MPAYNEEESLGPLIERSVAALSGMNGSFEIVIVDDGSGDATWSRLVELKRDYPELRGLRFEKNCGQTAAMDAGIRAARGRVIVTMDADLQNDPSDIPDLVARLAEADCVCGIRVERQDNLIRRISSRFANWVRNRLSNENISDTGCSLKVYRRECFAKLKLFEGMHRFLPTLIKMEGFTVIEAPVKHHHRQYGVSKYGVLNRVFKSFFDLLAVRWMKKRMLGYVIAEEK